MAGKNRAGREYRFVVRGELDDRFGLLFEGMRIERVQGTTVVTGTIVDQAHLLGVVEQIQELGLEVLSVEQSSQSTVGVDQGPSPQS